MARARGRERQEICAQRTFVGRALCPKGSARFPICSQAFVVRDRVLHGVFLSVDFGKQLR
jgi:hypothetical protein